MINDSPAGMSNDDDNDALRVLKHDIKNQLSNIVLSVDQLRYELPNANTDCKFYLDTIAGSCDEILALLNKA